MASHDLPYFCPRCDHARFPSVLELRAHLVSCHTYETLLVLSRTRARTSSPRALALLAAPAAQRQSSFLGLEQLPLACLDLASCSASAQLLRELFIKDDHLGTSRTAAPSAGPLALPTSLARLSGDRLDLGDLGRISLGLEFGRGLCLEERLGLGLDQRMARTFAEVEERVEHRVGRLKAELERREEELQTQRRAGERLGQEKREVEQRASLLSRQVQISVEMMAELQADLQGKERALDQTQQEVCEIESFLRETAEREAVAKARLQVFIEALLERADRAERQLLQLNTHGRVRTLSLGSGGWERPGGWQRPGGWGGCRTWRKGPHRHHSTEEEEEEEEEDSLSEDQPWSTPEIAVRSTHSPGTDAPPLDVSSVDSSPYRRGDGALGAGLLRLRAGLFCVFPFLDVRTLLLAAEVCSDWRMVARHPAVWTHVRLEDARVSVQFLTTLSQWCTQTQALVLHKLRPRPRHPVERREDYHKNTRACLEGGLEALLRSAGRSLLLLQVSHCPHVLTDRSLWLASCYCHHLHTLTYRSSSDPLGHEVVWALGTGCRSITHLQVAPLHPCQQPTRFSNRCLQTIGRCWPHLRVLGVGGAGCSVQGLAAVVRSCVSLQVLELERVSGLDQQGAGEQLCREGLQQLHTLTLTSTPVTTETLLHLHRVCAGLRSMVVRLGVTDWDADSSDAQRHKQDMISSLQALQQCPGVCDVLQLRDSADILLRPPTSPHQS
ncbi:F-box only protein 41-like [Osmerus mordax]|uniref:F-box only protein 41-like n=1 Tax=Osmerus mordax TaxID=8014 RepID=UPI00350F65D1